MGRKKEKGQVGYEYAYVREHYNKDVRREILEQVNRGEREVMEFVNKGRKRKKQRIWTLNRSPHGNKTAREQFGREIWQRTVGVKRNKGKREIDPLQARKEVVQGRKDYVSRKEKKQA